ncbi:MAG: pantoate--beta-alanine ligase [Myxococcales bacterium]
MIFSEPSTEEADQRFAAALGPDVVLASDDALTKLDHGIQITRVNPIDPFLDAGAVPGVASVDPDGDVYLRRMPTHGDGFAAEILDEKGDLEKCTSGGVDFVYAPPPSEVYPPGYQTWVEVEALQQGLCGAKRPGHFRGVATVVTKLLALFRPEVALFGEKDFQQLKVIERLNRDLELGVDVVGMPIVRESDGLAMSSRNAYLSPDERQRALALVRGLRAAAHLRQNGEHQVEKLKLAARAELANAEVREDYVEVVHPDTLAPLTHLEGPARMLIAAFLGKTRLIDNAPL